MKKILYIHNGYSTFVEKDILIFKEEFLVEVFYFQVSKKYLLPVSFLKELFFILRHCFSTKKIVIQFGGFHSFLPVYLGKLFSIKTAIILSGTDCVSFPSINYGNFNRTFLKFFTKISLRSVNMLIPVDNSLVKYNYTYQNEDYPQQGYLFHDPKIKTKFEVVYYGYDSALWNSKHPKEKNSFVTIAANLSSRFGLKLKGIDLILETAPLLPDYKFYIIGGKSIHKSINIPPNVILIDRIPNSELSDFIGNKQFYLQLSMSEGFPNALCEAMLCECIPIVSNVASMPKIVGYDQDLILLKKDSSMLKELILNLTNLSSKTEKEIAARDQIKNNFSYSNRKSSLLRILKDL